jgi:tetratricopeptide (TPR) repeat protein
VYGQLVTAWQAAAPTTTEDQRRWANSLNNLGNAYQSLGEYHRAISLHEQSLEIMRAIGDRGGEAASLGNLGNAYFSLGEYRRAISLHEQSLAI